MERSGTRCASFSDIFYKFAARHFYGLERRISDWVGLFFRDLDRWKAKNVRFVKTFAIEKVWIRVSSIQGRRVLGEKRFWSCDAKTSIGNADEQG